MCRQRADCNAGTLTARSLVCREGCAGKGQAATLEQQRLTARGLGGSCREEAVQQLEGCKGFERLKGLGGRWREGFGGF